MSTVTDAAGRSATQGPTHPAEPHGSRALGQAAVVLGLAAVLVTIPFVTGGGVDETAASPGNTWTEIFLTLVGAAVVAAGLFRLPRRRRWGGVTLGLMFALFAFTSASIAWSVAPDSSWLACGQLLSYLAVFAAAIVMARVRPDGWQSLLGALVLACVAFSLWSLVVKVFPALLAPNNQYGRLLAPFGYWNALALTAAMGLPACLWLGARREADRRLVILTPAAISLLVAVLVLSYSRSADIAAVVGVGLWLAFVPVRLRAISLLLVGMLGGAAISVWALTHHALNAFGVRPALQQHAGGPFGVVILVTLLVMAGAGALLQRRLDGLSLSPRARRRAGAAVCVAIGAVVLVAIIGVALSSRGLTGEISHGWNELTNPRAVVSANSAGRVLQVGSSRPLYWHEAIAVGDLAYWKGTGALGFSVARLRAYPGDPTTVFQAHSYVFETYADLGIIGLLLTGALLLAWLITTRRALALGTRWTALDPERQRERIGLATLAVIVVTFGVQSTLDWTWYFAGVAVPALLAAGWLAGLGPLLPAGRNETEPVTRDEPEQTRARRWALPLDRPGVTAIATVLALLTLAGCWMLWRPLHSAQLVTEVENGHGDAVAQAEAARRADPLSLVPYELLSVLYADDPSRARGELLQATRVQPRNPNAWALLAAFDVKRHAWRQAILPLHMVQVLDRTTDALATDNAAEIHTALSHLPSASG